MGVWRLVRDVFSVAFVVWCLTCGIWRLVCGVWCESVGCGVGCVPCDVSRYVTAQHKSLAKQRDAVSFLDIRGILS